MPFRLYSVVVVGSALLICIAGVPNELAHAQKKPKRMPSQQFKGYGGLPEPVKAQPESLPKVAAVDASRSDECRAVAAKIDGLVAAKLSEQGLEPSRLADDYTFVRRVFLDAIGSIPSMRESLAYEQSTQARKQEVVIDGLLSSYGYVSHLYNYWASVLRITDRPEADLLTYSYRDWIKEQLRTNRPYNEWVYEMLTAEGKIWENPAVGYTLRDNGMPLVHVDNTVRVFLGTQIGCAQCHDHPYDRWTQKEFYQLAAFTHGTKTRDGGGAVTRVREALKAEDPDQRLEGSMDHVLQANRYRVSFSDRKLKLPHDYQYDDAKPNQAVEAAVLWGEIPDDANSLTPREQYARWLTSPENPLFAKTIANRLWKKVMGVGLIEPVDDLRDDSPCQNPELLELLTSEFIRLGFNQKEFIRTLMYTETYQRHSSEYDPGEAEFYHFPGPKLRRMTAEQIWDSVLTIAIYNPYSFTLPDNEKLAAVIDVDLDTVSVKEAEDRAQRFDDMVSPDARNKIMNSAGYRGQVLARASELPSPLPAGHFLRQFGQGDRETIEGDSLDPTVPQILTMFNGPFTHMMLEQGSVIYDNLARCRTPREATNVMFLSILNREPTSHDRDIAMHELSRGDLKMGYGNLVWALINTREFIFVQ